LWLSAGARAGIFVPIGSLIVHFKLTIMSTKFAVIGVVSVLSAGAVMHHARFCPLQKMMAAMHHSKVQTVAQKAPPAVAPGKTAGTVALR
jgi:hypothetical protein